MNPTRAAATFAALIAAAGAFAGQTEKLFIIDFEGFAEETPITDDYAGLGAVFSTPGRPNDPPIIAVEGSPTIAFIGSGADAPASSGMASLTDPLIGGDFGAPSDIAIDFDPPVTSVSLFIIDIDGDDVFTLRALSGGEEVDAETIGVGDPGVGNGVSTLFEVSGEAIDRVVLEPTDPTGTVGWAADFLTFTRPCTGAECGARVQIAQESAPGAGDFDDNILGEILPWPFTGSPEAFYGYGVPDGSSWNGAVLEPVPERSHLLLSAAGGGVSLTLVHDAPGNLGGGDAETKIELFGDPDGAAFGVFDDPKGGNSYVGEPGDSVFTAAQTWSSCCTDGYVLTGFGCTWTALVQFTDVDGDENNPAIDGLNEWVAYSADGQEIPLVLEEGRRIRLVQLPSECTGDLDADLLVTSADLNLVLAEFGCTEGCCADADGDGDVDSVDLNLILSGFGGACGG